eukprot:763754-Hanusia_phi.AAC.3
MESRERKMQAELRKMAVSRRWRQGSLMLMSELLLLPPCKRNDVCLSRSGVDNYEGSAYRQGEVPAVQEEAAQEEEAQVEEAQEEEAQVEEAQEEIARRGHRQRGAEENRNRIDWEALASLPYLKDVRDEATRAVAGPNDLISASSGQQKVAKRSRLGRISLQEESARRVTSRPPRQQGNLKLNKVQAESPTSERKMKLLAHQHSPRIISSSSRLIFYSGPT